MLALGARGPSDQAGVVHVAADAAITLPGQATSDVRVELTAGRNRYSVGGCITEGPRWWRGEIRWPDGKPPVRDGVEVVIELVDGRTGLAVIEPAPAAPEGTSVVRGVGPPPFEVP